MNEHLHPAEKQAIKSIAYKMAEHNLSTVDLSSIMGLAGNFEARKVLDGERHLRFVEVIRLAEFLKISPAFFIYSEDSNKLPDTLGGLLRQRRSELGMTQEEIGAIIGISRQNYNRMENKGGG